jgi:hypothetical protein
MNFEELVEVCAQATHEANRALCTIQGDNSQLSWAQTPEENRAVSREGVRAVLSNPLLTPKDLHQKWMDEKTKEGWVYGPKKDPTAKTHPSMVSYEKLPEPEKDKDRVFRGIVDKAMRAYVAEQAKKVACRFAARRVNRDDDKAEALWNNGGKTKAIDWMKRKLIPAVKKLVDVKKNWMSELTGDLEEVNNEVAKLIQEWFRTNFGYPADKSQDRAAIQLVGQVVGDLHMTTLPRDKRMPAPTPEFTQRLYERLQDYVEVLRSA